MPVGPQSGPRPENPSTNIQQPISKPPLLQRYVTYVRSRINVLYASYNSHDFFEIAVITVHPINV